MRRRVRGGRAWRCAAELARRGIGLVTGGGSVGLMGVVADAALAAGVEVIGVIPRALASREVGHAGLTELRLVDSMHERKALMAALSDAFVALPGGVGTLEETFEVLSWAQLGIHAKPIGALNVAGYWDDLIRFLAHTVREGFVRPECLGPDPVRPDPRGAPGRARRLAAALVSAPLAPARRRPSRPPGPTGPARAVGGVIHRYPQFDRRRAESCNYPIGRSKYYERIGGGGPQSTGPTDPAGPTPGDRREGGY